jgi:sterol desaturase/sphingolipid hydroxylase (fatty acid hydroxylase superfamily)
VAGLDDAGFTGWVGGLLTNWGRLAAELLLSPGSPYSLAAIAICTALAAFATLSGRRRKRSVPFKVLLRAIFPRRIVRSRSGRADLAFTFFNIFIWAALFGWAVFSASEIGRLVQQGLSSLLGAPSPAPLPGFLCAALMTGALYVAYEFGYWLDHYLAHKIPLLWHFHKVHHSAESLSPITVFRVHPVDTLVYYNILALVMGGTQGLVGFALGTPTGVLALGGTNILLLATGILLVQLQHSHLWISFSGRLGRSC